MTPGTLYLIPNTLGGSAATPAEQLHAVIPQQVTDPTVAGKSLADLARADLATLPK